MDLMEQLTQEPLLAGVIGAVVVVAVVALIVWLVARRRRAARFERRFGAEYQRTVDASGSRRRAEQDLEERRRRREQMKVRTLAPGEREEMRVRFEELQTSFVDAPEAALRSVDNLLDEVAGLRGYDEAGGSRRLSFVSLDHPEDLAVHQRNMSRLSEGKGPGTEDLRQSMLSARRVLELLVAEGEGEDPDAPRPPRSLLGLDEDDEQPVATRDDRADAPASDHRDDDSDRAGLDDARDDRLDDLSDDSLDGDRDRETSGAPRGDASGDGRVDDGDGSDGQASDGRKPDGEHELGGRRRRRRSGRDDLRDPEFAGEASARTLSTRPDEDQHVGETIDLTEEERTRRR